MNTNSVSILTHEQIQRLQQSIEGRIVVVCFGAGVDSTAMLCALHAANIRPELITFADTGAEKNITYQHVQKMNQVLPSWGWSLVTVCKKITLESTSYDDLFGNCIDNETLPALAFENRVQSSGSKVRRTHILKARSPALLSALPIQSG
ncbi:adenine nucleotide alpha hydrolase family protein [Undibacterium oligocarboniphilum]|uniref:Phosphoadenosine phosphosulphate reductase domain-containing protein n=1 Tax=Undibacterium oligocarboniphilum TaxID=666702 RepID=A0A850QJW9_9BURK|nr:hypothetical protein [Undibacterium oligocarboniphilum]MBC3871781.1 hypothetical protein [Undibacterium oligocarboniphilum]NVO79417.1 hypothetical protein [Undibacterium oligocarboniphilum]